MMERVPTTEIVKDAFDVTKVGEQRKNISSKAKARLMTKSCQLKNIWSIILDPKVSCKPQVLALCEAANHHDLRSVVKSASLVQPIMAEVALFHEEQQKRLLLGANTRTTPKGRTNDQKCSFVEANLVACADSQGDATAPKKISQIKSLGLKCSTGY